MGLGQQAFGGGGRVIVQLSGFCCKRFLVLKNKSGYGSGNRKPQILATWTLRGPYYSWAP